MNEEKLKEVILKIKSDTYSDNTRLFLLEILEALLETPPKK
jgi:hypothetical protein